MSARRLVILAALLCCACRGEIREDERAPADPSAAPRPSAPAVAPDERTAESVRERCDRSQPGPPLLRRLTRRQIENSLRDAFPEVQSSWSGFGLSDVSSTLGFSNDANALVVSRQSADALLQSAEQLADLASDEARLPLVLPCAGHAPDAACARELIERYGERLFRRPLTAAELERYGSLFDSIAAAGSFARGAKWTLVALIQSPHTLYRRELGELAANETELTPYELASELAYTFADSAPDSSLLERARRGELSSPEVRVEEARRLLDGPRGREMVQQFVREWLRYSGVRTSDRPDVPNWSAVRGKLVAETERFVEHVVYDEAGGLRDLLTAPYTFLDRELGEHYGIAAPSDALELSARPDGQGAGILSQGAVLAYAANVHATSPTQRGLLVYERLLCRTRPKPPANVPPLAASDPLQPRTTRERYEKAHAQGVCNSCHSQFDPLGFAFEHFDEGGRFRSDEAGEPIDASGQLAIPGGELAFDSEEALASALADSATVRDCVSGLLVQYAFGGGGGASCLAEEARAGLSDGKLGLIESLAQLAAAPHFSRRARNAGSMAAPEPAEAVADGGPGGSDASASQPDAAEPDAGAGTMEASEIGLTVQYQAGNAQPHDNVIGPYLQISNVSASAGVALDSLALRYYFTNEHGSLCPDGCTIESFYAGMHPSGAGVEALRSYVAVSEAQAYLEITFAAGSPLLMPGQSVEVQQHFHTQPYEDFDESDDYSFDPARTTFGDSRRISLYRAGKLVWGKPP